MQLKPFEPVGTEKGWNGSLREGGLWKPKATKDWLFDVVNFQ